MNKNKFPSEVLDLTIDHINDKGNGVAFHRHASDQNSIGKKLVVFIPNVVPGDEVRVTVPNAKGRKRALVELDEILKPSPNRNLSNPIKPTIAGGTPLQYMNYNAQLEYKENLVNTYLEKEGFDTSLVRSIIGVDNPNHYRNKMELTFGLNGELGMHQQGNFKNVIDLEESIIAPQIMMDIKHIISQWQKDHDLKGYDKEKHVGLLRHLMLRKSIATGEIMIALFATEAPVEGLKEVSEDLIYRITTNIKGVKSLVWFVNNDWADRTQAEEQYVLAGRDFIYDEMSGYRYRLWFDTFFQINPRQTERLVDIALEMANPKKTEKMIDLFCGVGTFSLPFASRVKSLAGVEIVETAIESAKRNAEDNGIDNTLFIAKDARRGIDEVLEVFGRPDLLMLDPPRSGAGGKVMRRIGRAEPSRIIYVSCNPESLAFDLKELVPFGYRIEEVQPIDLFPHTTHVECVVLIEKE